MHACMVRYKLANSCCNHSSPACYMLVAITAGPPATCTLQSQHPAIAAITAAPPLTCSLQSQQPRLLHARCNHSTPPATCSLQSQHPASYMLAAIKVAPPLTCSLQSQQPRLLHARCNHSSSASYMLAATVATGLIQIATLLCSRV